MKRSIRSLVFLTTVFSFVTFFTALAYANHTWGNYHWARTANPFTLKLGDNVSSAWDSYLNTTASDWSVSSVLDTTVVTGDTTSRRCRPTSGGVEVCNDRYGNNGWLGVAQIWASGDHITQGAVKMNDTYFNTSTYNKPTWRNLVMCQEVGHTLGLDHQDENFNNTPLGTCMDYSSNPDLNQHPNAHDYEQLEEIYAHLDGFTTIQSSTQKLPLGLSVAEAAKDQDFENRSDWGKEIKNNGKVALFERDFGLGHKLFTFVIWAQE